MENVLQVYARPYDPECPIICLDETTRQLLEDVRAPILCKDGSLRVDNEYKRKGTAEIYMIFEPLIGKRYVEVRETHNRFDWAQVLVKIIREHYHEAKKITIVQDNLSAHKPHALYEILPAHEARELLNRLEFVFTPAHGSWLNMAEIENGVMKRQALKLRIGDKELFEKHIKAWAENRNLMEVKVNWQFKTKDARIKLAHLYPKLD